MSHVDTMKVKVTDLNALGKGGAHCGLELIKKSTYKWFGRSVGDYPLPAGFTKADLGKCDYVLRIPGNSEAYEIGVVERNGEFILLWDFWQGGFGLEEKVGKGGINLIKEYGAQLAIKDMQNKGYEAERAVVKGQLQVKVRA